MLRYMPPSNAAPRPSVERGSKRWRPALLEGLSVVVGMDWLVGRGKGDNSMECDHRKANSEMFRMNEIFVIISCMERKP